VAQNRVEIVGLRDFQRELRSVHRELPRITAGVHRKFAREVRDDAQDLAMALPGRQRFARLITSSGTAKEAKIVYRGTKHPASMGWIFGAASRRKRQFAPWIGNKFDGGMSEFEVSLYAVGPAIKANVPRIRDEYAKRVYEAFKAAFPGGSS